MTSTKGVPRRGPTTPLWVETRICEIWLDLTTKGGGHEPTANRVYAVLQDILQRPPVLADVPSLRKVQDVIKENREALRKRLLLDTPWSLGSLAKFDIPSDALADVLETWKWSLAIGNPLTIREAQWVGRLRTTHPFASEGKLHEDWAGYLYGWAHIYARRERATQALGNPNDTSDTRDLDAQLVEMDAWEWHTAYLVGVFKDPWLLREEDRRLSDKEDALERESGHYSTVIGGLPHDHMESEILGGFHAWWVNPHEIGPGTTAYERIDPTLEESKVYAYWLRRLSKGPKWDAIPTASPEQVADLLHRVPRAGVPGALRFEHQKQIAVRLRDEILAVSEATRQYREAAQKQAIHDRGGTTKNWGDVLQSYPSPEYSIGPEPGPVPSIPTIPTDGTLPTMLTEEEYFNSWPPFSAWKPKDLLKEVGLD